MKKCFIIQPRKVCKGKLHTWKLNDRDVVNNFKEKLNNLLESEKNLNLESVEDRWQHQNYCGCGLSEKGKWHKETWCHNISENNAVEIKEPVEDLEK